MTDDDLQEIRDRCEAATPGPWVWILADAHGFDLYPQATLLAGAKPLRYNQSDRRFIAHARQDVPALLAEVERLAQRGEEALARVLILEDAAKVLNWIDEAGGENDEWDAVEKWNTALKHARAVIAELNAPSPVATVAAAQGSPCPPAGTPPL